MRMFVDLWINHTITNNWIDLYKHWNYLILSFESLIQYRLLENIYKLQRENTSQVSLINES